MLKQEKLTAKAVVLYIIHLNPYYKENKQRIYNILYIANKANLTIYGTNLIEDTFYAGETGPIPKYIAKNIDVFINSGEKYDELDLSISDIQCLDECYKNTFKLSDAELNSLIIGDEYLNALKRHDKLITINEILKTLNVSDEHKSYIFENYIIRKSLLSLKNLVE